MKKLLIVCLVVLLIFISFSACTPPHTRTPYTLVPPVDSFQQPNTPNPQSTVLPYSILSKKIVIQLVDKFEQPIKNALVSISSPSISAIEFKSNQSGIVTFQNISSDQFYNLNIEATGYIQKQVNHVNLSSTLAPIKITLTKESYIFGQIKSESGEAIEETAISFQGNLSTLSDKNGQFKLQYETQFPTELTISRQGYISETKVLNDSSLTIYNLGIVNLKKNSTPLSCLIYLVNHAQLTKEKFALLNSVLIKEGFQVQFVDSSSLLNLSNVDVVFIPSPNQKFSIDEFNQLVSFVSKGGKLIVSGEWSGYGEFNIDFANQILEPFGLQFGNDLLRESINSNSGTLNINQLAPHYITKGVSQIQFYQATSVYMSKQNTQSEILARMADNAFRIAKAATSLKMGGFGVLGVSIVGNGKVVALGDTSFWLNNDSDKNQVPNLNEDQNRLLAKQIFEW